MVSGNRAHVIFLRTCPGNGVSAQNGVHGETRDSLFGLVRLLCACVCWGEKFLVGCCSGHVVPISMKLEERMAEGEPISGSIAGQYSHQTS